MSVYESMTREQRQDRARNARAVAVAKHGDLWRAGRVSFRQSFLWGHECRVCPLQTVPSDLPLEERQRQAAELRHSHYVRVGVQRGKR